jgi:hypothetical protein
MKTSAFATRAHGWEPSCQTQALVHKPEIEERYSLVFGGKLYNSERGFVVAGGDFIMIGGDFCAGSGHSFFGSALPTMKNHGG